jgi:Uma2 family endonuclease
MATVAREGPAAPAPAPVSTPQPGQVYDRSSLAGDYMVMIAGQTADDFERFAPESQFCEYFDGIVYMPSPVTDRHQEQAAFFVHLLDGFRCERGGGKVLMGPAVLRLSPEWKPEPDVFVRPRPDAPSPQPLAALVIEILSPSTRSHDLGLKCRAYQAAGIPEIWVVDDREHCFHAVSRGASGEYVENVLSEGFLHSSVIPGFWLDISWLWTDPLPNARRCLDQVLAGPPAPP